MSYEKITLIHGRLELVKEFGDWKIHGVEAERYIDITDQNFITFLEDFILNNGSSISQDINVIELILITLFSIMEGIDIND